MMFARSAVSNLLRTALLCVSLLLVQGHASQAEEYAIKVATPETPPSFHNLYLQIAYELGIFKKNGLIVSEFIQLKGGPLATQAVVSGQADVTATDVEGILNATKSGYGVRAVSAPAAKLSYVIVARQEITSFTDFKGKPFAISRPSALSQYVTFPFLAKSGLTKTDIQWLSVGSSKDRLFALMADRVKGAVMDIATYVEARDNKNIHVLARVADVMPLYPHELLLVRKDDIDKNPEKVTRIVQSIIEACRYLMADRDGSINVFMKYASVDRAQAEDAYDQLFALKGWGVNGGMTKERLDAALDTSVQNKAIEVPVPLDQWADFKYQAEALRRLGGPIAE